MDATEINKSIGREIRIRRTALGIRPETLAGALNISSQQYKKYERGEDRIPASRLYDVAHLLDTYVDDLFPGEHHATSRMNPSTSSLQLDRECAALLRALSRIENVDLAKVVGDAIRVAASAAAKARTTHRTEANDADA